MHNLKLITPLGKNRPTIEKIGSISLSEEVDFALASISIRVGQDKTFRTAAKKFLDMGLPDIQKVSSSKDWTLFWSGPDQFFAATPLDKNLDIAADLTKAFGGSASITEQTGGWVRFALEGADSIAVMERLCAADTAAMSKGDAVRSVIEHMGVFILCDASKTRFTIYGASSSAQSLQHALATAARSVA